MTHSSSRISVPVSSNMASTWMNMLYDSTTHEIVLSQTVEVLCDMYKHTQYVIFVTKTRIYQYYTRIITIHKPVFVLRPCLVWSLSNNLRLSLCLCPKFLVVRKYEFCFETFNIPRYYHYIIVCTGLDRNPSLLNLRHLHPPYCLYHNFSLFMHDFNLIDSSVLRWTRSTFENTSMHPFRIWVRQCE